MFARRCLIASLALLVGVSLVIAADAPSLKKPQGGRKLSYSFSNSSNKAITIILTAYSPNNEGDGKSYKDKVPPRKTKQFTATLFDGDGQDFVVQVLKGNSSLLEQEFNLADGSIIAPGNGMPGAVNLAPPEDHLDFAVHPVSGNLIWSVNNYP